MRYRWGILHTTGNIQGGVQNNPEVVNRNGDNGERNGVLLKG
jgi:hypothetical protein